MSSNIQPEGAPVEAAPPAPAEVPRDDSGRFAPPAPVVAQPQPPVAAPTAPAPYSAEEASRFYGDFYDPQKRPEAFVRAGRQYGFIPEGIESADEAAQALRQYAEWKQSQGQPQGIQQPQVPQPGYGQQPQGGYEPDPGYIDPDEFRQSVIDGTLAAMDQREQAQRQQAQMQEQLAVVHNAVGSVAAGLPEQAQTVLLQNVALGIDAAQERGERVDFSPEAMGAYAASVLESLRALSATGQQQQVQDQVQQHRRMAPLTTTPQGPGQAGAPSGPRGMAGAMQRARQGIAAEQGGG